MCVQYGVRAVLSRDTSHTLTGVNPEDLNIAPCTEVCISDCIDKSKHIFRIHPLFFCFIFQFTSKYRAYCPSIGLLGRFVLSLLGHIVLWLGKVENPRLRRAELAQNICGRNPRLAVSGLLTIIAHPICRISKWRARRPLTLRYQAPEARPCSA